MKLFQFSWGIYPRRILIYLKEKGISDIELVDIDVVKGENRTPEFLKMNPLGTIPVLEAENGEHICQSTSILQYLEETFPTPDMSGQSIEEDAQTHDQLMLVNDAYNFASMCTFQASPLFAERRNQADEAARAFHFEYAQILKNLEALSGDGDFLGGTAPNIADVAFYASEQFMRDLYKLQLPDEFERLEAIFQRFAKRPSAKPAIFPQFVVDNAPLRTFQ